MKKRTVLSILTTVLIALNACAQFQQRVNVKTLFRMLPEKVFPEYVPYDDQEAKESHISECDYKNGYLELGGAQYAWEMCYWNLKDGRKLVAVNQHTETGSVIYTFFYEKGKLREDKNYKLGGEQTYRLEDFVDVSQLSPEVLAEAKENFNKGNYSLYFGLPQKGTSLKVWIDAYSLAIDEEGGNGAIPYDATKTVTIKWINEKWVRQ